MPFSSSTIASIHRLDDPRDLDAFVAHLGPWDIHARFGRIVARDQVARLLVPPAPRSMAIAARCADHVVGTALLAGLSHCCAEMAVLVRADFRNRGVGAALVQDVLRQARLSGIAQVIAHVNAGNVAALRLLRSASFRPDPVQGTELLLVAAIGVQGPPPHRATRHASAEFIGPTGPCA